MAAVARLDCETDTLALISAGGPPAIAYWGPRLPAGADLGALAAWAAPAVPHGGFDAGEALDLAPEAGRGFCGRPAAQFRRADGASVTQLALRALDADGRSAAVTLADDAFGLRVRQQLILHPCGVLTITAQAVNVGDQALEVVRLAPGAIACAHEEALRFSGRWAGEFAVERTRLGLGLLAQENRTGRTSHHAPPFLIVGDRGFSEESGAVLGLHLAWSGDCDVIMERLRDGRVQLQAAVLLQPGEIVLAPGQTYETPALFVARSTEGLNGLSARFHRVVREVVTAGRLARRPRPAQFNTWEATYFDHDAARLTALADRAADLGLERFVLDDGWFKGRRDDTAGLGDWTPDAAVYPGGLAPLADHVRARGMTFGLWVEPECATADSDLLRAHPDWALGAPGRGQPLGRGQYVLDLTRGEVCDHLFDAVAAAVRDSGATYLKWDMNRDLAHAVSGGRPAGVAQTLAVYALIDRVRAAFPDLEVEACASGGARADYAMLARAERIWLSDCNDPLDRQRQQRAASLFFPPEAIGAHVGPRASHTTGRITRMDTRALTALFGHFGVEADLTRLSAEEDATLAAAVALYKRLRGVLHSGRTWRLAHPDPGLIAHAVEDADGGLIVSLAQVDSPRFAPPAPLRLWMLDTARAYRVGWIAAPGRPQAAMKRPPAWDAPGAPEAPGALLAAAGLPPPVLRPGDVAILAVEPA